MGPYRPTHCTPPLLAVVHPGSMLLVAFACLGLSLIAVAYLDAVCHAREGGCRREGGGRRIWPPMPPVAPRRREAPDAAPMRRPLCIGVGDRQMQFLHATCRAHEGGGCRIRQRGDSPRSGHPSVAHARPTAARAEARPR